jgi:hypothetical protein
MNTFYKMVTDDLTSYYRKRDGVQYVVGKTAIALDEWDPDTKRRCAPGGLYFCDEEQFKHWLWCGIGYDDKNVTILEVEPEPFSEEEPRIVYGEDKNKAYQLKVKSATPIEQFMAEHMDWVEESPQFFIYLPEELQTEEMCMKAVELDPLCYWENDVKNLDLRETCRLRRTLYCFLQKKKEKEKGKFFF